MCVYTHVHVKFMGVASVIKKFLLFKGIVRHVRASLFLCMLRVMTALDQEGRGQGPAKRPQVPGLIDAGLVPLQTLMHQCWHPVSHAQSFTKT